MVSQEIKLSVLDLFTVLLLSEIEQLRAIFFTFISTKFRNVKNIKSLTIINTIGINLNKNQKISIIKTFEKLKNQYTGKS